MSSYIGATPTIGGYHKLDSITTDGSASYTMQLDSANFVPESVNHLIVSVNGVIQAPTDSFTVSSSTITFASSLSASDTIDFIMALGNVLDIGTPSDSTVSSSKIIDGAVSLAKLSATGTKDSTTFLRGDNTFAVPSGGENTPAFFSIMSTNQTISANTATLINFDNEQLDTDSAFDITNKRFTVPTGKGGYYFLYAAVGVDDGSTSSQQSLTLYVNGNRQNTTGLGTRTFNAIGSYGIQTSAIFNLSAGDYIDARARLETTTALYDQLIGDDMRSRFFGYRLIGVS